MLVESTLLGKTDKVQIAIDRLKAHEPEEGYFLAFSGGKDSMVIEHLARQAEVKYDAHYHLTTVDPPELVRFIKKQYPEVIIDKPEKTMWELIVKKKIVPLRQMRWCCKELKEGGGVGRIVATGVRWEESSKRSKRRMVEQCNQHIDKIFIHPIIDWSGEEVWEYIRKYKLEYCKLYDEGFKRLGCVLCPMASEKQKRKEAERWPKIAQAYKRAIKRVIKIRTREGLVNNHKDEEEYFDWWITGKKTDGKEEQPTLFE